MGKWIDTDAAYAVLTDYYHHSTDTQHAALREALGRVETVDAVEVVRCKDCMHYGFTDNRIPEEQVWWCYFWDDVRSPDAYCSDGEREDGDHAEGTV